MQRIVGGAAVLIRDLGVANVSLDDIRDATSTSKSQRVEALIDAGEIDENTSPGHAASAILAAVTGGATMLQATGPITYLEASLTEALNGLRAQQGR